jgi:hypothetical protein
MATMARSWDLKVKRAEKHLKELKTELRRYAAKKPYRAVRVRQPRGQRHIWRYVLEMTEQPDPMLAVITGDCLFNLRSALDHLAVGMAPNSRRNSAAWPVEFTDPWEVRRDGSCVYDEERRKSFASKVKGIDPKAVAMIKFAQPYEREHPEVDTIALISRLENADKHRQLITLGSGIRKLHTLVRVGDEILEQGDLGFRGEGAEVAKFAFPSRPDLKESEVHVEISGTATVAIKIADVDGNFPMPTALEALVHFMRDVAIPEFTPYVREET